MSEPPGRTCPRCSRPAATAGARCLYCGAALEAAQAPEAPSRFDGDAPGPSRALLILDLSKGDPEPLARILGISSFEAGQRVRRGGFHLERVGGEESVGLEAERLRAAGLAATVIAEAEARVAPLLAIRGSYEAGTLSVRHARGELRLRQEDLLMMVHGPIAREYQPSKETKRVRAATLEPGHRFHLHRRGDLAPLELDPGAFEFGAAREGSSLLAISAWLQELTAGVPVDDHFRRLAPALGSASPEATGALGAAASLGGARPKDAPLILDNLAQFRFYSGWRSAVERRRAG